MQIDWTFHVFQKRLQHPLTIQQFASTKIEHFEVKNVEGIEHKLIRSIPA
jgi:hypothetical protein